MHQAIYQFPDLPDAPDVRVDLEDGTVLGLEDVLPHLDARRALRLVQVLVVAGEAFERFGNYAAACPAYAAAARAAEAANNPFSQSVCLNNLALAYKHQGKYDEAIPRFEKAITLVTQPLSDPAYEALRQPRLANSLCNLAILYQAKGDKEKKRHYAAWALRVVESREEPDCLRVAGECRTLLS